MGDVNKNRARTGQLHRMRNADRSQCGQDDLVIRPQSRTRKAA